jgi:hypothetical protein
LRQVSRDVAGAVGVALRIGRGDFNFPPVRGLALNVSEQPLHDVRFVLSGEELFPCHKDACGRPSDDRH